MNPNTSQKSAVLLWAAFSLPVLWAAALLASVYENGMNLFELMVAFETAWKTPFSVTWTARTPTFLLGALTLYAVCVCLFLSSRKNRRPGVEHGSARWGQPKQLNAKYRDRDKRKNVILTQNIQMGLDGRKHRRNLLQIVVGGSGSGKTRFFCLPNLMLANTSYLVTDPKGEMLRSVAPLLLDEGYTIRVFDLIDTAHSDRFNPFAYIRSDKDVLRLVDNLIRNTTPKNAQQNDPFWEKSEIALDSAIIFYLLYEAPPEEQTLEMVLCMLSYAGAKEENDDYKSALDLLFEALEEEQPEHIALKQYKVFKQAAGKTAKSIIISQKCGSPPSTSRMSHGSPRRTICRLGAWEKENRPSSASFRTVTTTPSTTLSGCSTPALFKNCITAQISSTAAACRAVRLIMDEFANVALPDGYERLQSTMRSRNIMSTIVLQNISQLKALFKDSWEGLIGNADALLYLGGNEQSTHKYISELLGKETIDTQTSSQSRGTHGNSSVNYQQAGRELMTPDEVRMLDNDYAVLLLRGERPVIDRKYEVLKHPNVKRTATGGAPPYIHRPDLSYEAADLSFSFEDLSEIEIMEETV